MRDTGLDLDDHRAAHDLPPAATAAINRGDLPMQLPQPVASIPPRLTGRTMPGRRETGPRPLRIPMIIKAPHGRIRPLTCDSRKLCVVPRRTRVTKLFGGGRPLGRRAT